MATVDTIARWQVASDPFPFEALLNLYRSRLTAKESQILRQHIQDDDRWLGHWESLQLLDSAREYTDRLADRLQRFTPDQATDRCRAVAAASGELLWPLVDPRAGSLDPRFGSAADWQDHRDHCSYCRLMLDDLRSELVRQRGRFPLGELTARDWLLDHRVRAGLDRVTRDLQPAPAARVEEAIRLAGQIAAPAGDLFKLLGWDEPRLRDLAGRSQLPTKSQQQADPLFALAMGGEPEQTEGVEGSESTGSPVPIVTSPIWFTRLLAAPVRLLWGPLGERRRYKVEMHVVYGPTIAEIEVDQPVLALSDKDRQRMPTGRSIAWSVTDGESGRPVVSGAFDVLDTAARQELVVRLDLDDEHPPMLVRRLEIVLKLLQEKLFESAFGLLDDLQRRYSQGATGFLIARFSAAVWRAMYNEISRRGQTDAVERYWSRQLLELAIAAAYRALFE